MAMQAGEHDERREKEKLKEIQRKKEEEERDRLLSVEVCGRRSKGKRWNRRTFFFFHCVLLSRERRLLKVL